MKEKEHCHVDPIEKLVTPTQRKNENIAYLWILGMGCNNCAQRVYNGIVSLEGVYSTSIYLQDGIAEVSFNPEASSVEDLVAAVQSAGNDGRHHYQAQLLQIEPVVQS